MTNRSTFLATCSSLLLVLLGVPTTTWAQLSSDDVTLRIVVRDSWLPGVPLLVRLELRDADGSYHRDAWDCEATLTAPGFQLEPSRVPIYNGLGSALVTPAGDGDLTLHAAACGLEASKPIRNLSGDAPTEVDGDLPVGEVEWSGIVHVTGDTRVPVGTTLRVLPGTLVLLAGVDSGSGGADINVEGVIHSQGTPDRPVTFTAMDPRLAWGELHHNEPEDVASSYRYTVVTRAGNSPGGGHTGTGPAVRPEEATITFESCTISDNNGKVMESEDSDLQFRDCHMARSVMGPEIDGTALLVEETSITEMFGEDDNDGIYIHGQQSGQRVLLSRSVVAHGDDDAIDTLGSEVTIEDCIVRDFADKGVSVFHDTVHIDRCLIVDNDIGVSAKTSDGRVLRLSIDRSTIVGCRLGIQARDKNGQPDARILYDVQSSIVRRNGEADSASVDTDYDPSDISITYSALGDPEEQWATATGNIDVLPRFVDEASHDYRLREDSPCIDAGSPTSPLDADGTRADMGARPFTATQGEPRFRRGDVNRDGGIDLSDGVTVLLYLFAGRTVDCEDAGDADDDGNVRINDAVFLLEYLFRAGPAPRAPFQSCGVDTTDDELDCALASC